MTATWLLPVLTLKPNVKQLVGMVGARCSSLSPWHQLVEQPVVGVNLLHSRLPYDCIILSSEGSKGARSSVVLLATLTPNVEHLVGAREERPGETRKMVASASRPYRETSCAEGFIPS
jgi:hypothetical protein